MGDDPEPIVRDLVPISYNCPSSPEFIVHADLRGVDAVEVLVEADRPAGARSARCDSCDAAARPRVIQANEHIFGLNAPMCGKSPFDAPADRPRGHNTPIGGRRNHPVAAPGGGRQTRVDHRAPNRDEGRTAFDIEQDAIPGVTQPTSRHAVPVADSRTAQNIRSRLPAPYGWGIKRISSQAQLANLAFNAEHKG